MPAKIVQKDATRHLQGDMEVVVTDASKAAHILKVVMHEIEKQEDVELGPGKYKVMFTASVIKEDE